MAHVALEVILISLACAAAECYNGICGTWFGRGLCGCLWFVLPLEASSCCELMMETMWMFVGHAVARNHVEAHDPCSH